MRRDVLPVEHTVHAILEQGGEAGEDVGLDGGPCSRKAEEESLLTRKSVCESQLWDTALTPEASVQKDIAPLRPIFCMTRYEARSEPITPQAA